MSHFNNNQEHHGEDRPQPPHGQFNQDRPSSPRGQHQEQQYGDQQQHGGQHQQQHGGIGQTISSKFNNFTHDSDGLDKSHIAGAAAGAALLGAAGFAAAKHFRGDNNQNDNVEEQDGNQQSFSDRIGNFIHDKDGLDKSHIAGGIAGAAILGYAANAAVKHFKNND
ncbi:hypothetical protein BX661DRAFT_221492 [Kickxella alabastrina]|uniref:uncharacterized protein n=1 Tax=Kickxella alabastrina TaxID=61397 RepID=UPI00221FCE59|nr:uncharacterized protein BX661DRAFT_221492 [Kickxella alabastrina]KAI7834484.1 hypothetical protein BX661DRAFT_221492 [Kickxella alabastrina]